MSDQSSVASDDLPPNEIVPGLPERPEDAHKGTFGKVLIIGGSVGMSGAVCLSSLAALRSGSGLVTAAVPCSIQAIVAMHEPCVMTLGLECDTDGQLASPSAERVESLLAGKDVIAIGPGLGQSPAAIELLTKVLSACQVPLVIDADALNIAAAHDLFSSHASQVPRVITPHPGEFARLTGKPVAQSEETRLELATEFAKKHSLIVVLKGHRTVITNGERVFINTTGNSGMATAGCGDVLTGMVASLLGQKMDAFEAAVLAVHSHGRAGNIIANELGQRGMIASDLVNALPRAWEQLDAR